MSSRRRRLAARYARCAAVWAGIAVLWPAAVRAQSYQFYVASESADEVALLRFTPPATLAVEKTIGVGFWPAEMEGPHGIAVDQTGRHWYVSLAHGFPFGWLVKYAAGADTMVGRAELGLFPASVTVGPGDIAFVVNSNFHGEHVPSSVSVVDGVTMTELERLETCTMPHGSRLTGDGTAHYSTCMMDDELVEIDAVGIRVARRLRLGAGHAGAGHSTPAECSPTWAAPSADGRMVYVTCNRGNEIVEVDRRLWGVTRRWASPAGPYNAQVTPDNALLIVTQKGSGEVSIWRLPSAERAAVIPSTRRVTHGVAVPPDGRYAFVTVEGIGGEPGAVDVIDLRSLRKVASVDVGKQAGGIAFWRTVPR